MTPPLPPATESLTAKEQALFELLTLHRGRLFSRADILERVWGLDFVGDDRIVDAYVTRVRRKLGDGVIETVRGAGYRRPESPDQRQAWPHLRHLSADARTILNLGRRVLHIHSADGVLLEVASVLALSQQVSGLALLNAPSDQQQLWLVGSQWSTEEVEVDWAALPRTVLETQQPLYLSGWSAARRSLALLPLAGPGGVWGALAALGAPGVTWDSAGYAQLEAVAALVNPALRLGQEVRLRQQAERDLREINARLEDTVQRRTRHLLREKQQVEMLSRLSLQMEQALDVDELLALSLPTLAKLAGVGACAAWLPRTQPHALACLRADGTFAPAPALPALCPALGQDDGDGGNGGDNGLGSTVGSTMVGTIASEVNGEPFVLQFFGAKSPESLGPLSGLSGRRDPGSAGEWPPEGSAQALLLHTATQSLALMLSRHLTMAALERTALTDESTGLGNRRALLADLHSEVAFSARHGSGFALALVEIANIRFLNATVGYAGGNDAIWQVAQTLAGRGRAEDRAYRVNGATFALLLRGATGGLSRPLATTLSGWRERLHHALHELQRSAPAQIAVQIELRYADVLCPDEAQQTSELLRLVLERLSALPPSALPPSALPPSALPPSALPPSVLPPSVLPAKATQPDPTEEQARG